jgi:hypothetical protein
VLRAAFNSNFIEGQTQTYTLENVDIKAFPLVVQWMYSKTFRPYLTQEQTDYVDSLPLPRDRKSDLATMGTIKDKFGLRCCNLVNVWIIADYLQLPRLQNFTVDEIEKMRVDSRLRPSGCLHIIYERFPPEASMRQLIFEICRRFAHSVDYADALKEGTTPHLLEYLVDHVTADKRAKEKPETLNSFRDRGEFIRRFHVPEDD